MLLAALFVYTTKEMNEKKIIFVFFIKHTCLGDFGSSMIETGHNLDLI
jgi:hypothetical protein